MTSHPLLAIRIALDDSPTGRKGVRCFSGRSYAGNLSRPHVDASCTCGTGFTTRRPRRVAHGLVEFANHFLIILSTDVGLVVRPVLSTNGTHGAATTMLFVPNS